jgi:CheY-like chemotaxis protein
LIGDHIEMEIVLAPKLWLVKVDPAQIEQVIVNLVVNAHDAMPDGGRLVVETANAALDDQDVADRLGLQPGEYVLLSVSDTGIGMSKEVQTHIFEPFFTTKEQGKGTGLGLSTVFGIVKQNGGHVFVYSESGQGTIFKIYFPRTKEPLDTGKRRTKRDRRISDLPRGSETVLLAEDEPAVRDLAARVLRRQGYTVLEASNGVEALKLTEKHVEEIHILLTDTVMPKMSGEALAEQFCKLRPSSKILFTSGYSDKVVMFKEAMEVDIDFLQKPFSAVELARKVRSVLDS